MHRPVHPGLSWAQASPAGRRWLEHLPRIVDGCAERWSLRLGRPFPYAYASLALPATMPDGTRAVLKIQLPHRESEHEAAALSRWDGGGAVRLLAHDEERRALLLERCEPGTPLWEVGQATALDAMIGLLPRLWLPAGGPFRPLAEEAAWWAEHLPRSWRRAGKPWLVIDPKPLVGERAFGIAALVRGDELGRAPDHIRHRLDRLTGALGVDRARTRDWTLAQTLAWSFEGDEVLPLHVETASWLMDAA